jgi:hypothetical protein
MAEAKAKTANQGGPDEDCVDCPDPDESAAAIKTLVGTGGNGASPVQIDLEHLLIGDLEFLERAGNKDLPPSELVDFLDRVVVGGVRHLPLGRLVSIVEALGEAVSEAANPVKPGDNLGN